MINLEAFFEEATEKFEERPRGTVEIKCNLHINEAKTLAFELGKKYPQFNWHAGPSFSRRPGSLIFAEQKNIGGSK